MRTEVDTILHVLAQRPHLTGSGVTLDALVRLAATDFDQHVIVGVPDDDPAPAVGGLAPERVHPLVFDAHVPGMSDVMPYPSTRFSTMDAAALAAYEARWRDHLARVLAEVRPALIHTHHAWIVSALVCELATVPVFVHGHATGLRQMDLCKPEVGQRVIAALGTADAFVVLSDDHRARMIDKLGVSPSRVHVVGAGYDTATFSRGPGGERRGLAFVGKLSEAKGLGALLDVLARRPDLELHVAGAGAGDEAAALIARMAALDNVTWHGRVSNEALVAMLRRAAVFVLPSFYEGLPLVIVEALACGCRAVASALPGVLSIAARVPDAIETVALPRLDVDRPHPDDLPAFVDRLEAAIDTACAEPAAAPDLSAFTWAGVYARVRAVWQESLRRAQPV